MDMNERLKAMHEAGVGVTLGPDLKPSKEWKIAASAGTDPQQFIASWGDCTLTYEQAKIVEHRANAYPQLIDHIKTVLSYLALINTRNRSEEVHYDRLHRLLRDLGEVE